MQLEKSTKGGGRQEMRGKSGNEEEVGCQTRNTANLPHVVLVSCGKTGCLLGSKSEQPEKEGNSRKKREIDGKAVKTSSRVENFAAVLRSQTLRLLTLKACSKGRRVLRGDLVSAFLHVLAVMSLSTRGSQRASR